jgi:tetratricopeptide (TPR) repeat protein
MPRLQAPLPTDLEDGLYDEIWERLAMSPVLFRAIDEITEAEGLMRELLAVSPQRQRAIAANNPRFRSRALAELLLAGNESEETLNLALDIARNLDLEEATKAPLVARALALRGEAERRRGRLASASRDLKLAMKLIQGSPDALEERAIVCAAAGRLRLAQGAADEAAAFLERAADAYDDVGELASSAEVLIELGKVHLEMADIERALAAFEEALFTMEIPPDVSFQALQGATACLVLEGRLEEARESVLTWMERLPPEARRAPKT